MEGDIPILRKTYDLYKLFYEYSVHFPKKDRLVMGRRCENLLLELIEKIIKASKLHKENKMPVLFEASLKIDLLKIFMRLIKELRMIDLKKYTALQEGLFEIGKMLGGWIKSLK